MSTIGDRIKAQARAATVQRRPGQVAMALAVALLGFLLATQFRAHTSLVSRLAGEREADLAQLLSDLQQQSDELVDEVVALRVQLATTSGSQDQQRALLQNATEQLAGLRILLGLVPVRGPGVSVVVADPESTVGPDLVVDAIQELRDAGAEAIDVNGVRVVATTSFSGEPGAIVADRTTRLQSPYSITAIGAQSTLAEAMRIPGGVIDSIQSRHGASVGVDERKSLVISSLRPAPRFAYATRA